MATAPYVLARSIKEAHEFARESLGLPYGKYRIVNSPGTVKSVRGAQLHLVPGWKKRFDFFSMKQAIRWTRMEIVEHPLQAEEPVDGLNPPGVQQTLTEGADPALVAEFEAFLTQGLPAEFAPPSDPLTDLEAAKDAVEQADTVRRRRTRCKECGQLIEPGGMDDHLTEHLPTEV